MNNPTSRDDKQSRITPQELGNSPILKRPIILGDLTLASPTTQTTVGAAGAASALPATPTAYIQVMVGSTKFVLPLYAVS